MAINPTKINFPENVNCCDSTISIENKTNCLNTIKTQFKDIEKTANYISGALYIFYKGNDFTGQPIGYKYKNNISIDNVIDSPVNQADNFCCRIISYLTVPKDDDYQFQVNTNDGARVYLNNYLIANTTENTPAANLAAIATANMAKLATIPGISSIKLPNIAPDKNISDKVKLFTNLTYLLTIEFTESVGTAALDFTYLNSTNNKWESIPSSWLTVFKPYSDTYTTYDTSMNTYCSKSDPNNKNIGLYQTAQVCKDYLINNPAVNLVKTITDYCKMGDNQKTDYCNNPSKDIFSMAISQKKDLKDEAFNQEMNKKYNKSLLNELTSNKLEYALKKIKESNYTDEYAISFIFNEWIPYINMETNNNINEVFRALSGRDFKLINQEFITYVEKNDPELSNVFIKKIYDMFKNVDKSLIQQSWIRLMTGNCQKLNSQNQLRYQVEPQCQTFLKTNQELNKTVLDFCNTNNIQGKYCTDLDNSNITNKIAKKEYNVNTKLGDDLMKQRMNLTKQKLIESKYTDPYAISYFNKEFKSLADLDNKTNIKNYNEYVLTPESLKYCEDNYLDIENKFCKPTLATYANQNSVIKTVDKIKEQTCIYNNNFVTDADCNTYSNLPQNYNKFIQSNNKYCSSEDNIANEYCQKYYKNVEDKLTQNLQSENCTKSSFSNLESFENDMEYNFNFIYMLLLCIIIALLIPYYIRNRNIKYNEKEKKE